jgi:hypothetical protein
MTIKYLYPVQDADVIKASMAPRLDTLEGITLGLLPNSKGNSFRLHEMIGEEIGEKFNLAGVEVINKGQASANCAPEIIEEIVKQADAVITGLGD